MFEAEPDTLAALTRRVLAVVETIPRGRVMSYGDIGQALGVGPRQVAKVLATRVDDELPWWRVVRSDGSCALVVRARQVMRLREEGVAMRGATRVEMRRARHTLT